MRDAGIADSFLCAPELEFYLFSNIWFSTTPYQSGFDLTPGSENEPPESEDNNSGVPINGSSYLISGPQDIWRNERQTMVNLMIDAGLPVRYHHVEVGPGQQEIELCFLPADEAADGIMLGKYLIRSVADDCGIKACFMPKPIANVAGNGMHIHFRMLKNEQNLLAGNGYGGLSDIGKFFAGGILSHGRSLLALMCPTTNSYIRLRPGHETPTRFFYSSANREAAIRIPKYSTGVNVRCEFRPGDATMNPYLGIAAMLMAGLDGVVRRIDPEPLNLGPFDGVPPAVDPSTCPDCFLPRSLEESLRALETDHDFLTRNDVFSQNLLDNFLTYKREQEIVPIQASPHPLEYEMYWTI
jgi:glutamine synthetase